MKVTLISHTVDAEKVVAAAAKLCYSSAVDVDTLMDGLTPEKVEAFLDKLVSLGHESPTEHASYTFAVEGVSRSLSHQLVRHRIASYSQRSQRYCSERQFEYVIPASIYNDPSARVHEAFEEAMKNAQDAYDFLVEMGVPKEDARQVLPNACCTRIVITMNARALNHFFEERCCTRAQSEIRKMANLMLDEAKKTSPILFKNAGPKCKRKGYCPEGAMSCGAAPTMEKLLEAYNTK